MNNDEVLAWVQMVGGDYVWEDDLFAITLLDVTIDASGVERLLRVEGLDQLAIDVSRIEDAELRRLAQLPGLGSLVLSGRSLSESDLAALRALGPDVDLVVD